MRRAGLILGGRGSRLAVAAYAVAWLLCAAVVAAVALAALDDDGAEDVSLPPIQETELADAARKAGCELRRASRGERLNPPVDGPRMSAPAAGGFYEDAPDVAALTAALRSGVVVIHFRSGLGRDRVDELRTVQEAAPNATIVTPNATQMPFEVGVTAYRRLLGCRQASDAAIEAVLLFRGRFLGSGPDP